VNKECSGKFRNPIRSMKIVRQISDFLCAERGLSIIEEPKKSRGSYRDWQDKKEPQTNKDKLREIIDNCISAGMVFEQFIAAMHEAGCEVKRGKYISFKIPGAERFIRVKSLGDDYTEQALRDYCVGKRPIPKRANSEADTERKIAEYAASQDRPNLLIDIQAKIREGAGEGYVQWMRIFNLKNAARTLIFLQEHKMDSYDELCKRSDAASSEFNKLSSRLKEIGERKKKITELQTQIGNYGKTRNIYAKYKASGWSRGFYDIHSTDINLHRTAKKYFDEIGMKKTPSINELKREWAILDAEQKKLSPGYKPAKENYMSICTAKANADVMLFGSRQTQKSHDRGAR
jgi:hypothetical protein